MSREATLVRGGTRLTAVSSLVGAVIVIGGILLGPCLSSVAVVSASTTADRGPLSSNLSPHWSGWTQLSRGRAGILSMSCPTAAFCVGVDVPGDAYTYSDGVWSSPRLIPQQQRVADASVTTRPGSPSPTFDSVSCPSSNFCVTVDQLGNAYTYLGGSWEGPTSLYKGALYSVSCPSSAFCIAVDQAGAAWTYYNDVWSKTPEQVTTGGALYSVSCPTADWCMAVGQNGRAYSYGGQRWSTGTAVAKGGTPLYAVSCPTTGFCESVADTTVDGNQYGAYTYTYSKGKWSQPKRWPGSGIQAISCVTSRFCVAVGQSGTPDNQSQEAWTYAGGSWSNGYILSQGSSLLNIHTVACPTTTFCVAAGNLSRVYIYTA
jgi:hypothetical protein